MLAFCVVEHFDVVEHVLSGIVAGVLGPTPDPFALQQLEEAFGDGIVVTVSASAHAGFQIVLAEECLRFAAVELGTLIGMHGDPTLGLASPHGYEQGLKCKIRG